MANPIKGEVALVVGERAYKLRLGINAIVEVEDLLGGKSINEIVANVLDVPRARLGTLRALLWGALREHHSALSVADAGLIIETAGPDAIGTKMAEVLKAAFPKLDASARPQEPVVDGTGSNS